MKEIIRPKFLIEKEKLERITKAAPLMLEALKQIMDKCSELDYPDCCIISKVAQAAIDAAEGKGGK